MHFSDLSRAYSALQSLCARHARVIGLFVAALAVRCISYALFHADFWYTTYLIDDVQFYSWAHRILGGDIFGRAEGVFQLNPGYAYVLALIYGIFRSAAQAPHIIQYILGALNVVLLYLLARRVFSERVALVSGIIAACYGMAVFYAGKLLGAVWIESCNLILLLLLVRAREEGKRWQYIAAGAIMGLSALFRPNIMLFAPLAFFWLALPLVRQGRPGWLRAGRAGVLFALGAGLVLAPVTLRNWMIDRASGFVLTTAAGGINIFIGNNPEANGYNAWPSFIRYAPGAMHEDFKKEAERRIGRPMDDAEVSGYWLGESFAWMRAQPARAVRLMWRKVMYFWNAVEPPDNFLMDTVRRFTRLFGIPLISWGMVAPLALLGAALALARREQTLLHWYLLACLLMNMLVYVLSRYRYPAIIAVIPLAAYALVWLYECARRRAFGRLGLALAALACAVWFVHIRVIIGEVEWSKQYSIGIIYYNRGRTEEAIEAYQKSIAANPRFAPSRINLGTIYVAQEQYAEATEQFLAAAALAPEQVSELLRVAGELTAFKLDDPAGAIALLRRAHEADPGSRPVRDALGRVHIALGDFSAAEKIYRKLAADGPQDAAAAYALGLTHYYQQDFEQAAVWFRETLVRDPAHEDARRAIAYLREKR